MNGDSISLTINQRVALYDIPGALVKVTDVSWGSLRAVNEHGSTWVIQADGTVTKIANGLPDGT